MPKLKCGAEIKVGKRWLLDNKRVGKWAFTVQVHDPNQVFYVASNADMEGGLDLVYSGRHMRFIVADRAIPALILLLRKMQKNAKRR